MPAAHAAAPHRHGWSLVAKAVLGFWLLHMAWRGAAAVASGGPAELADPALYAGQAVALVLAVGYCLLLDRTTARGLPFGLGMAALLALPVSAVFASAELFLFYQLSPTLRSTTPPRTLPDGTTVRVEPNGKVTYRRNGKDVTVLLPSPKEMVRAAALRTVTLNAGGWYFFYFGLGAFVVGMRHAQRLRRNEQLLAEYERLAQRSQLEALRYQINPHFLFNTLNSLSAQVMAGRRDEAETMILNLSRFFRTTLAIDPAADITLREELALQQLYLDIEAVRFPDRLRTEIRVPAHLLSARVPALLLQPLVENAVKHAVARSAVPVTLAITAAARGDDRIELAVANDAPLRAPRDDAGHACGVGQRNVAQRLRTRFGDAASFVTGMCGGRYVVRLTLPLVRR